MTQFYSEHVRVISSNCAHQPTKAIKKMIGGEFEVCSIHFDNKAIGVYTKDKSDYWYFNFSDVVFLTGVVFNGNRIGVGDEVETKDGIKAIVTGQYVNDEQIILTIKTKATGALNVSVNSILSHIKKKT
jgi:hypothetical protein